MNSNLISKRFFLSIIGFIVYLITIHSTVYEPVTLATAVVLILSPFVISESINKPKKDV